ncbi:phosphopeptide-binding protein, partial [Cellulomonas bogoriensis 69B4 = DSM 16987]
PAASPAAAPQAPRPLPTDDDVADTGEVPLVPHPPAPRTTTPGPHAPLADDVDMTRLRPARGKVPQVPHAVGPDVVLDLTDGRSIHVSGPVLVGRNPTPRAGEEDSTLVAVDDPGRSVSKTHLQLGLDRNGVWVRDRNSTNGTVVTLVDGQQILCGSEQQVRLVPGCSVAFGDHGFAVRHLEPAPGPTDGSAQGPT